MAPKKRVAESPASTPAKRVKGDQRGSVLKTDEIAKLSQGCRQHLKAAVDDALAQLNAAKRKAGDGEGDHKTKAGLHKRAVDNIGAHKRKLKASDDRLAAASDHLSKATDHHAQKRSDLDVAKNDHETSDSLYKKHFLPLKGTVKENTNKPWSATYGPHVAALEPKLAEIPVEDCLVAGFKAAAGKKPEDRKAFCNQTMQEVDKLLQKSLAGKKSAVDAATHPHLTAEQALKDSNDAQDRATKENRDAAAKVEAGEDDERKAKAAVDAAYDDLERLKQDVKDATQLHDDKEADFDNFMDKERELLEAEKRVDDAVKKLSALEAAVSAAQERKARTAKDVDRADEGLEEAKKKCREAKLEADEARAAAADAKAKLADAVAELARNEGLIKTHFLPLKAGKFKNADEVHAHMRALSPIFENVEINPCLKAGFDAASCHTKDERGPFCSKVVVEVERCLEEYLAKLRAEIAALRGPLDKLDVEAKRLGALQDRACGPAVAEAEAFLARKVAANDDATKDLEKAQEALDGFEADLGAKVQDRDDKLAEAKVACGNGCGKH